jgi:pseudomonalisin
MPIQASSFVARFSTATRRISVLSLIGLSSGGLLVSAAHAQVNSQDWVSTKTRAFIAPQKNTLASGVLVAPQAASNATAAVAANKPLHVVVTLKLRNQQALEKFIHEVNQPGSPNFRQYLTPQQVLDTYAPTEAQVAAVQRYLIQAGFTNVQVAKNRMLVTADGTAATAKAAFNTSLVQFNDAGRQVYANSSDAQVPSALADVVDTVLGLQNVVTAHTNYHLAKPAQPGASVALSARKSATAQAAQAVVTPHNPVEFSSLYGAGSTPTASSTTIGIISEGDLTQTLSDLQTFTSNNSLGTVQTNVVQTGASGSDYSDTSGTVEWNLDSQSIVGAAGGAVNQLMFYDAPSMNLSDITAAYNQAVTDNIAKVINVSLGVCEADAQQGGSQSADDAIFKVGMAQGQTFSVAAGDHGVYECQNGVPPSNLSTYSVGEPATSPYVIAVGGTSLYTTNGQYDHETVWNSGLDNTGALWATGGGVSQYETAPSWQSSVTGNQQRTVPDIGFDADSASGAILVYAGQTTGTIPGYGPNDSNVVGGTSLAAPIFSGIWARVQSANNNGLAFPASTIYSRASSDPSLVHSVVSGNNGITQNGVTYGYSATTGFDFDTGWGSFNIAQLNTDFGSAPASASNGNSGSSDTGSPADLFSMIASLLHSWWDLLSGSSSTTA